MSDNERLAVDVMRWQLIRPEDIGLHKSNSSAYYRPEQGTICGVFVMNKSRWHPEDIEHE